MSNSGRRPVLSMVLAITAALALVGQNGVAQSDSTWREHERALQEARKADDTVAYHAQLDAIYHVLGATPRIANRFAALALQANDTAGASRWLSTIAAMGAELDTALLARYRAIAGPRALDSLRATSALAA